MAAEIVCSSERAGYRVGYARVKFEDLDWSQNEVSMAPIRLKNVERLVQRYKRQTCLRLLAENFVQVKVELSELQDSLTRAKLVTQDLENENHIRALHFSRKKAVRVVHGRHRLEAAKYFLPKADRWWIAEIFAKSTPEDTLRSIQHTFLGETNLSDGEIYYHFRRYVLAGDNVLAQSYLSKLSITKQRDVLQLIKNEPIIVEVLDRLLPFYGLWTRVELGMLHRVLTLRCQSAIKRYLEKVRFGWTKISSTLENGADYIDSSTVELLETLNPGLSTQDHRVVKKLMGKSEIFPFVSNEDHRAALLDTLWDFREPILSIYTFFEDTKLLEVATVPIRTLLPSRMKGDLEVCMEEIWTNPSSRPGRIKLKEFALSHLAEFESPPQYTFRVHMVQLVLFCVRNFELLTIWKPRLDKRKRDDCQPAGNANSTKQKLRLLFQQLGFETEAWDPIANPVQCAADEFLVQLRNENRAKVSEADRLDLARNIAANVQSWETDDQISASAHFTTNLISLRKDHRMGRPFNDGHEIDRDLTYFDVFYLSYRDRPRKFLTTLAVLRYTIIAFYGLSEVDFVVGQGRSPPRDDSHDRDTVGITTDLAQSSVAVSTSSSPSTEIMVESSPQSNVGHQTAAGENIDTPSMYSRSSSIPPSQLLITASKENASPYGFSKLADSGLGNFLDQYEKYLPALSLWLVILPKSREYAILDDIVTMELSVQKCNAGHVAATVNSKHEMRRHSLHGLRSTLTEGEDRIVLLFPATLHPYPHNDLPGFLQSYEFLW